MKVKLSRIVGKVEFKITVHSMRWSYFALYKTRKIALRFRFPVLSEGMHEGLNITTFEL